MDSNNLMKFAVQGAFGLLSRNFETIVAVFVLWLSYRLVRLGLEKVSQKPDAFDWHKYFAFIAPGVGLGIFGMVFVLGRDPTSLAMYLVTVTVFVGFGFAVLGYRLFVRGVLGSDVEAVWQDNKLLLRRAAPGTLFAFFGLVMIATALWRGPVILAGYLAEKRASEETQYSLIDGRTKEALVLLGRYLGQEGSELPAPRPSTSPVSPESR